MNPEQLSEFHTLVQVIDSVDAGIIVVDEDFHVCVWNRFMQAYSEINPDKALGKHLFDVVEGLPKAWMHERLAQVLTTQSRVFSSWENRPHIFQFENFCPLTGDQDYMYQDITFLPIYGLHGEVTHVCIKINDVSDFARYKKHLRNYNKHLKQVSERDGLTGLYNRGCWEAKIERAFSALQINHDKPATMLMMDIDHFKKANDTYGHQTGDQVIRDVASAMMRVLPASAVCGRYGGEEFVAFLPDCPLEHGWAMAEELRQTIESMDIHFGGRTIRVTSSAGVAGFSVSSHSKDHWLAQADDALYKAKESGRNQVIVAKSEAVATH
uniref:GGDEF domain-containing protein n=1 Tax=Thaumasiovibrio occultus TaxID=1891184 RepID=UPI000B35CE86|nr:diguanylate cyclase [Thaumasiovibrio occultus]